MPLTWIWGAPPQTALPRFRFFSTFLFFKPDLMENPNSVPEDMCLFSYKTLVGQVRIRLWDFQAPWLPQRGACRRQSERPP